MTFQFGDYVKWKNGSADPFYVDEPIGRFMVVAPYEELVDYVYVLCIVAAPATDWVETGEPFPIPIAELVLAEEGS